jgi:transposase
MLANSTRWCCRKSMRHGCLFLDEVAQRHQDDNPVMILNGGGSARPHDLVVLTNMRLLSLPPYGLELNPIELL